MKKKLIEMAIRLSMAAAAYYAVIEGNNGLGNLLIMFTWMMWAMVCFSFLCVLFSEECRKSMREALDKYRGFELLISRMWGIGLAGFLIYHNWVVTGGVYLSTVLLGWTAGLLSKIEEEK